MARTIIIFFFFIIQNLHADPDLVSTDEPTTTRQVIQEDKENERALVECTSDWHMRCKDGRGCIDKRWMCDGRIDCADSSDEDYRLCRYSKKSRGGRLDVKGKWAGPRHGCRGNWFFCGDASACIEPSRTCDGESDCKDGSDEGPFCLHMKDQKYRKAEDNLTYYDRK